MTNAILILSENQKQILFDYKECLGGPNVQNLTVYINDSILTQNQLKFLYDNKFKINSVDAVYIDANNNYKTNTYTIQDTDISFNTVIMFSIQTFNDIDDCGGEFPIEIHTNGNTGNDIITLYFNDSALPSYKVYDKQCNAINVNMESFMLLRTNPKLTGNIKLVVTEDYKLYLDTFKVSTTSILNKTIYRHRAIADDGNYPYDVYRVFKTVPKGEMYRVYDDSYNPHKNYYDPNLQIENIYEYGAEFNNDKLYTENMKILAPLYIGKHIPSYFAIFKTDNLINKNNLSNTDIFKQMIKDSECLKIFDLRTSTSIGKYLNNYKDMVSKYLAGTCSLQFIEQDNDVSSANYRQGRNTWKGIVYTKGILTDANETSYFANQTLNSSIGIQEKYNMFVLNGYSRNSLLYPNIINLEYMFNDPDAKNLSMHNYFGLYLTENDFLTFNQVIQTVDKNNNYILTYYDENNQVVNIDDTKVKILDNSGYADRLFFGTTLNSALNLKNRSNFNNFIINNVANKPYNNLVNQKCVKLICPDKSFITLSFNEPIHYGEHFKFVYIKGVESTVYEIIASNDEYLAGLKNNISQYIQTNTCDNVNIYRITFYTQDVDNPDIVASLDQQIYRLYCAVNKFKENISAAQYNENTISIVSDKNDMYFQHILSDISDGTAKQDNIHYFNYGNVYDCHTIYDMPELYSSKYKSFAINNFENLGNRYSSIVKFITLKDYSQYNIYEVVNNLYDVFNIKYIPLINTVNGYYPMTLFNIENDNLSFDISEIQSSQAQSSFTDMYCVISPYNVDRCIILSKFEASMNNDMININMPIKSNIALMGISQIKDINMYVDVNEYYHNETCTTASFSSGEKIDINGIDKRIKKYITYKMVSGHILGLPINANDVFMIACDKIYYTSNGIVKEYYIRQNVLTFDMNTTIEMAYSGMFDKYSYDTYKPLMEEENFYTDPNNIISSQLDIPLVPLINCQWKSNGIYFDTLSSLNTDTFTNYTVAGNFIENIYAPSQTNNQYISNNLNDIIDINGDKITVKDFILNYNYKNAIHKYLLKNFKIDTAIGYYNLYIDTLEFIYYGVKFTLKLSNTEYANEIKLNEYNNYEVFIINDYNSLKTNEIYISENEEFILIINHTYKTQEKYVNENAKKISNATIIDIPYTWYNADFNYDLMYTSVFNNILHIQKSNYYDIDDSTNIAYIVESDLHLNENFNEDDVYFTIDVSKYKVYKNHDEFVMNNNGKFDFTINDVTDNKITSLSDLQLINQRYAESVIDMRNKNTYILKKNITQPVSKQYIDKLNDYIASFNNNYDLYIIKNNSYKKYNINDNYKPLTLNIQKPNKIKFNHGLFDPEFIDIFTYNINDDIADDLNIDTLYANTCVKQIDDIQNVYYNKIMASGAKCDYNYYKSSQSPLSTDWDDNIYRIYKDDINYTNTYGYVIGITDKMMFGSKCLVMHDESAYITEWNYTSNSNNAAFINSTYNVNAATQDNLQITLNITDSFQNILLNDSEFINNWKSIGNNTNMSVYINNYIANTIFKLYDIAKPDIELYRLYDNTLSGNASEHFVKSYPYDIDKYELVNNVNTQLYNTNGKIILTITISDYKNFVFYPVIKINKI